MALSGSISCRGRVEGSPPPPPVATTAADSAPKPVSSDSVASSCIEHPAAPPPGIDGIDTTVHKDVRFGSTFLCRIHPALPIFRFDIQGDPSRNVILGARVHRGESAPVFQQLESGAEEAPYRGANYFQVVDLNADGYGDVLLMKWWGGSGNVGNDVWLFDPPTGRFVTDSELSDLANIGGPVPGRPCVRQFQTGFYGESEVCLEEGHWVEVHSVSEQPDSSGRLRIREERERRNGQLILVRTDTVVDSAQ